MTKARGHRSHRRGKVQALRSRSVWSGLHWKPLWLLARVGIEKLECQASKGIQRHLGIWEKWPRVVIVRKRKGGENGKRESIFTEGRNGILVCKRHGGPQQAMELSRESDVH